MRLYSLMIIILMGFVLLGIDDAEWAVVVQCVSGPPGLCDHWEVLG